MKAQLNRFVLKAISLLVLSGAIITTSAEQTFALAIKKGEIGCKIRYNFVTGKFEECTVEADVKVEITQAQIDFLINLAGIRIFPLKKLFNPFFSSNNLIQIPSQDILAGEFISVVDNSNDFDISIETNGQGEQNLLLNPNFSFGTPGEYGDINFTFKSTEDIVSGFSFIADGSGGSEQVLVDSKCVPEPSSILGTLALGTLGTASFLKRKQNQKSTKKETTKVG
jgi:hypothetical protein